MADRTASPSSVASGSTLTQQVGSRQGTRSRSRTTRKASGSAASSSSTAPPLPRYASEDHPLSAHRLAARGYHSFNCLGVPFHVPKRYKFIRELGIGAYGCVALARDEDLDMNVAIKKVTRVFERDVLARRALREVAILRHMLKNQNCTALIDFDTTFIDFSEIYLVLSASEADLSQIIRSGQALSDAHLQYFAAQLLRGVRYMHAANIIHRDLKPGNLLVNADCALFICDFGLARAFADASTEKEGGSGIEGRKQRGRREPPNEAPTVDQQPAPSSFASPLSPEQSSGTHGMQEIPAKDRPDPPSPAAAPAKPSKIRTTRLDFPGGPLTEYVSTRWYRAPEIMLGFNEGYGPEIDMWSVGCILAELATGRPLFDGKDYVDQIARIHGVLGPPSQSVLDRISSERAKVYVESLPKDSPPLPLRKILKTAAPGLIDLLEQLLVWDPKKRLTAEEAFRHPWLTAYHGIIDQWEKPEPFSKFDEVELIDTLSEFRSALQAESDEVKGEYAGLFGSGEDTPVSSADSAHEDSGDDRSSSRRSGRAEVRSMRPDAVMSSTAARAVSPSREAAMQDSGIPQASIDGPKGEDMELQQSSSAASSTSSLAGSSSNLTTMTRSEGYTTDPCSPLTSVGESAGLSSSSENSHFGGGVGRPAASLGNISKQRSFTMTTVKDEGGQVIGKIKTPFTARDSSSSRSSRPRALRTTSAHDTSASGWLAAQEGSSTGERRSATPRYRRRAITNAPRPALPGASEMLTASAHRSLSPRGGGGGAVRLPASSSVEIASLSLQDFSEDAGIGEEEHSVPARRHHTTTSRSHRHLHTPSPDFRRFTNDLISRPKYESGASASPALDAGDEVAKNLLQRRILAGGAPGDVTLTMGGRRDSREGSAGTDSSQSTIEAVASNTAQ